jgi:glucose/arabinose dehydrogenase
MRKRLLTLLLLCCAVLLILLALFSWKNLRGVGPALKSPTGDIARLLGEADAGNHTREMPLTLQKGFSISAFAKGLGRPRVMVFDPAGTLLVSVPSEGRVVALPDQDRDGTADRIVKVIDGLDQPHGMAFRCAPDCRLYIAEEPGERLFL